MNTSIVITVSLGISKSKVIETLNSLYDTPFFGVKFRKGEFISRVFSLDVKSTRAARTHFIVESVHDEYLLFIAEEKFKRAALINSAFNFVDIRPLLAYKKCEKVKPSLILKKKEKKIFKNKIIKKRSMAYYYQDASVSGPYYKAPIIKERSIELLNSLHNFIRLLRDNRLHEFQPYKLVAQMDTEGVSGESVPRQIQAENVSIEVQREDSVSKPKAAVGSVQARMAGSVKADSCYESEVSRWLYVGQYDWNSTQIQNHKIAELKLPYDAIRVNANQPNVYPFLIHRYWKGDMIIRIELNSNKFQVGMLQASWYYGAQYDNAYGTLRRNVHSASSRDHALLSAGSSNSALMVVPYRNFTSKLLCKSSNIGFYGEPLYLGSLLILVLSRLNVPVSSAQDCSFSVFVKFDNSQFSGMINRSMDISSLPDTKLECEMLSALALMGSATELVRAWKSDKNRDKPPLIDPPSNIVPNPMHSLSSMTGIFEPLYPMRMDPKGQTPHPSELLTDEMDIKYVCSKFALVNSFVWNSTDKKNQRLALYHAAPMVQDSKYSQVSVGSCPCFYYPPVAVISDMFAYWRGELEFRFDVVASQFHTGKLMVAYIPGSVAEVDTAQAKSSPFTIFDLHENRQFVFRVPYLANRPWWPRCNNASDKSNSYVPPGSIQIYVINRLIPMEAISGSVDILVYMRGAETFEVSIPVFPSKSLSFNTNHYKPPEPKECMPERGYFPFFTTWYHNIDNTYLTLFYGNVSGQVVLFSPMSYKIVYKTPAKVRSRDGTSDYDFKLTGFKPKGQGSVEVAITHIVRVLNNEYNIVYCFENYVDAFTYARDGDITKAGIRYIRAGGYCTYKDGADWYPCKSDMLVQFLESSSFVAQVEERSNIAYSPVCLIEPSVSTDFGLYTFGECVKDLKDICRRYCRYTDFDLDVNSVIRSPGWNAMIPVLFQRPALRILPDRDSMDNRLRDGVIPIVASGYRFARGGLRFKLVFTGLSLLDTVYIQFRPDRSMDDTSIVIKSSNSVQSYTDFLDPSYPSLIMSGRVNNCCEFEIPWYLSGDYTLLQPPSAYVLRRLINKEFMTLGCLYISIRSSGADQPHLINTEVFYSLADDARFSVFQGFPPLASVKTDDSSIEDSINWQFEMGLMDAIKASVDNTNSNNRLNFPNLNMVKDIKKTVSDVTEVSDKVNTLVNENSENITKSISGFAEIIEWIKVQIGGSLSVKQTVVGIIKSTVDWASLIAQVVTHVGYILINATWKTVVWALTCLLSTIFGLPVRFVKSIAKFWEKKEISVYKVPPLNEEEMQNYDPIIRDSDRDTSSKQKVDVCPPLKAEIDWSDEDATSLAAIVTTGLISVLNVAVDPPKSYKALSKGLFMQTRHVAATANTLTQFLRDNFKLFKRCFDWIAFQLSSESEFLSLLSSEDDNLAKWASGVISYTSEPTKSLIASDSTMVNQVFLYNAVGQYIKLAASRNQYKLFGSSYILNLANRIQGLADDLVNDKINSPVRYEPFVLYLYGASNIGKSRMLSKLSIDMLKHVNYTTRQDPIFTRSPGVPHWNGLRQQPIVLFDDFFNINSPEFGLLQVAELFHLKSCAVFNPPMAAIEEKKILYNPLIVVVASNEAFPNPTCLVHKPALYRRRDLLVHCRLRSNYVNVPISTIDPAVLDKLDHLEFYIHNNPADDGEIAFNKPHTSAAPFIKILNSNYSTYAQRELLNYNNRLQELTSLHPKDAVSIGDIMSNYISNLSKQRHDLFKLSKEDEDNLSSIMKNISIKVPLQAQMSLAVMVTGDFSDASTLDECLAKGGCPHNYYVRNYEKCRNVTYDPDENTYCFSNSNSVIPCCSCMWGDKTYKNCSYEIGTFHSVFIKGERQYINDAAHANRICDYLDPDFLSYYGGLMSVMNDLVKEKINAIRAQNRDVYDTLDKVDIKIGSEKKTVCVDDNQSRWSKIKKWFVKLWSKIKGVKKIIKWFSLALGVVGVIGGLAWGSKLSGDYIEREEFEELDNYKHKLLKYSAKPYSSVRKWMDEIRRDKCENVEIEYEPNIHSSGDTHNIKLSKTNRLAGRQLIAESGPGSEEAIIRKICRNTFFLRANGIQARCLGIYNRKFLILKHYIDILEKFDDLTILYDDSVTSIKWADILITNCSHGGYSLGELPARYNLFKNLLQYFPHSSRVFTYDPNCVLVSNNGRNTNIVCVKVRSINRVKVESTNVYKSWDIVDGFRYDYGGRGVCGSVLISVIGATPYIIGIHTAGSGGNHGVSESIVRDTFEVKRAYDQLEGQIGDLDYDNARFQITTVISPRGKLSSKEIVRLGDKTKIVPSLIHGVFPLASVPAPLSIHDVRVNHEISPLLAGCNKQGHIVGLFDKDLVDSAFDDLNSIILARCRPVRNLDYPLTFEQTVEGLDLVGYERMDMNTSEGYPWLKLRPKGCSNKSWLFDWENDKVTINGSLKFSLDRDVELLKDGFIPFMPFVDCLKDHRILKEKLDIPGKTRVFNISNIENTILLRQQYLDFCASYSAFRFDLENTIGINVNGPEWTRLASELVSFSPYLIDGDYSNYGPALSPQIIERAFAIMHNWCNYNTDYFDEFYAVGLSETVAHSYSIAHDLLYQRMAGLPSGCAITIQLNSLCNSLYIRIIYLELARLNDISKFDMVSFHKYVKIFHNGDDVILSVKGDIIKWFNAVSISDMFSKFNIGFTPASKGEILNEYLDLSEVQYLKCNFVGHPTRDDYMAKLDLRSVTDTANWIWKCDDVEQASIVNSEMSVRLAYGHGEKVLNDVRSSISLEWFKRGINIPLPRWKELDAQIWYKGENTFPKEYSALVDLKIK